MSDELRSAFREMFGVEHPHDFQIAVAEQLLVRGTSVILQAPTGSGKTWTALFPFLHAWRAGLSFPRKCLYAVPLRVLATQFKEDAENIIKETQWSDRKPEIRLQTGEQQDDPTFEKDLVFTTIDQVLSSALSVPYSLGYRRANVNSGAVFSSFLVCDELHLFPIDEQSGRGALATLIELLQTFGSSIPFLLMTATLSERMLELLEDQLGAAVVTVGEHELSKIESQQKMRCYHVVDSPLTPEVVVGQHQTRSIVICNQVQRAIDLYEKICRQVDDETQVRLLHSRFIKQHRQEKEATIREQFGKPKLGLVREQSLITVATQAIEVGLDITCERLHTELAPASAIIQRAGRCARYKGEEGDVFIYRLPADTNQPHLPYDATRCDNTWKALSDPRYNGQALQFSDEQAIVTAVHDTADEKLLNKIADESYNCWRYMSAAMFRGEKEGRTLLIRKVDSRTLLVHDEPKQIKNPYAWRGFSLFHGTLRGWMDQLQKVEGELPEWWLRYPEEVPDPTQESRHHVKYNWKSVHHPDQLNVSPIFVVHPDLVAYDRDRGFRLMSAETAINIAELCQEPPLATGAPQFQTRYNLESYADHIRNMHDYYRTSGLDQQIKLVGQRLSRNPAYDFSAEQFELAALLAIALHDVGKLQKKWQIWSRAYQKEIGESVFDPAMMIVHTHYKPDEHPHHAHAEKAVSKNLPRPHHAAEGACAAWPIIRHTLTNNDTLCRAVFTAIARHHAPFVKDVEAYELNGHSPSAVTEALKLVGVEGHLPTLQMSGKPLRKDVGLDHQLIRNDPDQWLVYMLIVRTLRLCDGHALEGAD